MEKLLTRFLQAGVLPAQLGVITPYEGQRANIVATLLRHGPLRQDLYKAVEVSSVDAFQVGDRALKMTGSLCITCAAPRVFQN